LFHFIDVDSLYFDFFDWVVETKGEGAGEEEVVLTFSVFVFMWFDEHTDEGIVIILILLSDILFFSSSSLSDEDEEEVNELSSNFPSMMIYCNEEDEETRSIMLFIMLMNLKYDLVFIDYFGLRAFYLSILKHKRITTSVCLSNLFLQ